MDMKYFLQNFIEQKLEESQNILVAKYVHKMGGNTLYLEIWKKLPSGNYYHTISNQHGINISPSSIDLRSGHATASKNVAKVTKYYDQDGDAGALKHLNSLLPGWKKAPLKESYSENDWKKDSEAVKKSKDPKFVSKMINKWGERGSAWLGHPALKEEIELSEKVELDHSRYLRSHGKKARGSGMWMFTSKDMGKPSSDEMVTVNGNLSSAAKEAAKKLGTNRVYVMESIELDEVSMSLAKKVQKARHAKGDEFRNKAGIHGTDTSSGKRAMDMATKNWDKADKTKAIISRRMGESVDLNETQQPYIVIDTNNDNTVVAMASDEKEAKRSISTAHLPPMEIKDKSGLKVVKSRKKQFIGHALKESDNLNEDIHNDLNDAIIDFQKKLMRMNRQLDPAIAKEVKTIDKLLDDLRTGPLFKIRPGR